MPGKISLLQLADYLTASAGRRKTIIKDASDPKPYIATTYNPATQAITADIVQNGGDGASITKAIARLNLSLSSSAPDWQKLHAKHCVEALKKYAAIKGSIGLDSFGVLPPNVGPGSMLISTVQVNISPEALLTKTVGNEKRVGALKLYFAKSRHLDKARADYIGALLVWYCEQHLAKHGLADHRCSIVFDLPGNARHEAPKGKIKIRKDLEAACEEISDRWPKSA